jgi:hypothetical protein
VNKAVWLVPVILMNAAGGRTGRLGDWPAARASDALAGNAVEGIDKITILAGTWKTNGQSLDTDFSKAGRDTSTLRNDCWRSGEFYSCDQFVNGESKALVIFTFNPGDGTYNTYAIIAGGKPATSGKLKIDGETWTYEKPQDSDSKPPYFRTVNVFEGANTIHFSVEFTRDNQHWTVMTQGVETRQK